MNAVSITLPQAQILRQHFQQRRFPSIGRLHTGQGAGAGTFWGGFTALTPH